MSDITSKGLNSFGCYSKIIHFMDAKLWQIKKKKIYDFLQLCVSFSFDILLLHSWIENLTGMIYKEKLLSTQNSKDPFSIKTLKKMLSNQ